MHINKASNTIWIQPVSMSHTVLFTKLTLLVTIKTGWSKMETFELEQSKVNVNQDKLFGV